MKTPTLAVLTLAALAAACGGGGDDDASATDRGAAAAPAKALSVRPGAGSSATATPTQVATMYALDFVGTAATGTSINDAGDVVGKSYTDPGCGPFCLPPQENVVWRAGQRIVLPAVPATDPAYQYPLYINNQGLIAGFTGIPGTTTRAALWSPGGTGYAAQNLGALPGMASADVAGIDDQGRIVGWSSTGGAIPTAAAPYLWSATTGMVDLRAQGYPNERPAAISPGGKVVTGGSWYQLGNPASAVPLPAVPRGFAGAGVNGSAINDAGDQAHFLVSTSTENLVYPFRLSNGGAWQQLSAAGTGHLSRYGMGSINAAQDVSFTAQSTGMIAPGPAGLGQDLGARISPAYAGATVTAGGPMNASGQILTQAMIGRSPRLVKMTPVSACSSNCVVSSALAMTAQFVQDPAFPGSCFQGGTMYNLSSATVTVTSETGVPLPDVQVTGRFMDDYWTNRPVSGLSNANGVVSWSYKGPCGVGAIAFLVDGATLGTRTLDRSRGVLAHSMIPVVTPPPVNQPPRAVPVVSCVAGKKCTLDGRGSSDPDGTIAAYRWTAANGSVMSTQPVFTRTYPVAGRNSATLEVTDNAGARNAKKVSFTVLR